MQTKPEQVKTIEDIQTCSALEYEVFVYDLGGDPYISGLITDWTPNCDVVTVGGRAIDTTKYHLTTIPF